MDFRNAPKKRTTNFREDETRLLIQLWGSPTVQNKLYLTHRKAPVMRLIASNMQRHGFFRTPDEIKTRIRNLKCLYHRIKKSLAGHGIGTVDPDWPHYKAMDDILSRKNALRQSLVYNHNLLSDVANGNIKEEIDDIELMNDDGDDYDSNSNGYYSSSDDEFEEPSSLMPSTITPMIIEDDDNKVVAHPIKIAPKPVVTTSAQPLTMPRIHIAKNLLATPATKLVPTSATKLVPTPATKLVPTPTPKLQTATISSTNKGNMPSFPFLILNNGQNGQKTVISNGNGLNVNNNNNNAEVCNLLKELLMVQKENLGLGKKSLEIEQQRLEVERQKLEFERTLGSQLLNMVPGLVDIFQKVNKKDEAPIIEVEDSKNFVGHPNFKDPVSLLKNSQDFKEAILDGIKKFMQQGASDTEAVTDSA
ncbi:unnamed protein product [Ceutorhynchus assimilis]|uniref:Myb/SANT-like DNA-binding domain-containing protein n=1 Tax=Ceutorhynchus assimilis TaxID=467358 RepID=A0A9N9MFC7_9CUCU|nr:unnamed protein product [Ceutorhynchus assimilis]